jgi:hypothetical protein
VVLLGLVSRLILAEASPKPKTAPDTGIEGVISVGPVRGGPSRQGVPDSAPLANTTFIVKSENGTVTSFETDGQGRFRIPLPSGHYIVSKKDWRAGIGNYSFEVDVVAGHMKTVQWSCDTGIR